MSKLSELLLNRAVKVEREELSPSVPTEAVAIPQRLSNEEKILQYVEKNKSKSYGIMQMAADLGIARGSISNLLKSLKRRGLLKDDFNLTNGTPLRTRSVSKRQLMSSKECEAKILAYVQANPGKEYTIAKLGKRIGVRPGSIYYYCGELIEKGLLQKGFNEGTTTPILESVPTPVAEPKKENLAEQIEFLTWTFVREKRSTDLLEFLGWIEQKSK